MTTMRTLRLAAPAVAPGLVLSLAFAAAPARAGGLADDTAVLDAVEPSVVTVAYTLRFDKGEAPYGGVWRSFYAASGQFYWKDLEDFVTEERPARRAGFVLAPRRVVTVDPLIHPRFVERIEVRFGEQTVTATPAAYGLDRAALVLELDGPLEGVRPLEFDAGAEGPYQVVTAMEMDGEWTLGSSALGTHPMRRRSTGDIVAVAADGLVVNGDGTPVGLTMTPELPADGSWKGSPARWALRDAESLAARLEALEAAAARRVVRVALSFRSPSGRDRATMFHRPGPGGEEATERNVAGVLLDGTRLLVLAELKPKSTARLERIRVYWPGGEVGEAAFAASLEDYGCFVAELREAVAGVTAERVETALLPRHALMLGAEVRVQGESRVGYVGRTRISGYEVGWRGQVYPDAAGDEATLFLFDEALRLAALPVTHRLKVTVEAPWDHAQALLTPVAYLWRALDGERFDPANVPLGEEDEHRLAWLGVELQALNQDLARLHDISDQTSDGESGALMIHVYEGSPAASAGLEVGDILLRLHVDGQPRPLEVEAEQDAYGFGFGGRYPWEQWDDLPEELFDQVPPPWPPVDNDLNRKITDLGFGTPFRAEVFRGGELVELDLIVTRSPAHYDAAARFEAEDLGLTVRDLTYEVRRYFQIGQDDPGVIISKLDKGSRSAIAGLRPFELIISVDDRPVHDTGDFEQAIAAPGEHRLLVKRMSEGRIVKIRKAES